jgi:hypothetical protein
MTITHRFLNLDAGNEIAFTGQDFLQQESKSIQHPFYGVQCLHILKAESKD